MPEYDSTTAQCLVFTFKDGLLSKIAHDLKLRATRWSLHVDPAAPSVKAEIDPASLRVESAIQGGSENPGALSDADKQKIAEQIRSEVLHVSHHPRITFSSTSAVPGPDGGYRLRGILHLHGQERPIELDTRIEGDRHVAEIELHQPDYGIVPFKAMMGTLKIKPVVRVRISIPL
jgi:polyisoprenoid-binding protein YceI